MGQQDDQKQGQSRDAERPTHDQGQDSGVMVDDQRSEDGATGSRETQMRSDEAKERDESWRPSDEPAAGDLAPGMKGNAPHLEPGKTGSEF